MTVGKIIDWSWYMYATKNLFAHDVIVLDAIDSHITVDNMFTWPLGSQEQGVYTHFNKRELPIHERYYYYYVTIPY